VGPRAILDAVVKRKIPSPCQELNPRTPIIQPIAQMTKHNHILDFSAFISRPTFLLASKRVSLFSFMVFILLPNKLISSA
jgi:hypothetical protein